MADEKDYELSDDDGLNDQVYVRVHSDPESWPFITIVDTYNHEDVCLTKEETVTLRKVLDKILEKS